MNESITAAFVAVIVTIGVYSVVNRICDTIDATHTQQMVMSLQETDGGTPPVPCTHHHDHTHAGPDTPEED